jgi:MtN3 and saliva related transmembrane protein
VLGGLQVAPPNGKCESMDGFPGYANVDAVHRRKREWNRIIVVCGISDRVTCQIELRFHIHLRSWIVRFCADDQHCQHLFARQPLECCALLHVAISCSGRLTDANIFAIVSIRAYGAPASEGRDLQTQWDGSEAMAAWFEIVGSVAAACTTLCWLPQSVKIIREKRTDGVSLITQSVFTFGTALWAVYGLLLNNRPVLFANLVTLAFALVILILKLRYP